MNFWCFHMVCDLVPGFLSISPNFHAHNVPREISWADDTIWPLCWLLIFLSMCWCGVGHFVRLLENASWSCFILSLTLQISANSPLSSPCLWASFLSPPNPSFSGIRKVRKFY
jgi:hypothetical protein